jgi:hypothetical protein
MARALVATLLLFAGPALAEPTTALPAAEPLSMRVDSAPFGLASPQLVLYEPSPVISKLALASSSITAPREPKKPKQPKEKKPDAPQVEGVDPDAGLGPERAAILLRSLTVPGWGQATLGHPGSAKAFAIVEAAIWTAFISFRVQETMRTSTYLRTAQLDAGIDLENADDEFRAIVGAYASSDEYNLLVVSRDAANLYLSDPENPDMEGYRAYIAQHSLSGDQAWRWADEPAFLRYGDQRQFAQKAGLRANAALGMAIANRLVSAIHAARLAGQKHEKQQPQQGWRLELEPGLAEPGRFRAALTTTF